MPRRHRTWIERTNCIALIQLIRLTVDQIGLNIKSRFCNRKLFMKNKPSNLDANETKGSLQIEEGVIVRCFYEIRIFCYSKASRIIENTDRSYWSISWFQAFFVGDIHVYQGEKGVWKEQFIKELIWILILKDLINFSLKSLKLT